MATSTANNSPDETTHTEQHLLQPERSLQFGTYDAYVDYLDDRNPVDGEVDVTEWHVGWVEDEGELVVRWSFYYQAGQVVLLTFEGVNYQRVDGEGFVGSNVQYQGQAPVGIVTNSATSYDLSYVVECPGGGQTLTLNAEAFEWPGSVTATNFVWAEGEGWRITSDSQATAHHLSFTGFHNTGCPCECSDPSKPDLKDSLNTYINGIIQSTGGTTNGVYAALVLAPHTFPLSHITAIEEWLYVNHKNDMTGVYNDLRRAAAAPCMKLCGECVGTDKIGHFFEEGFLYYLVKKLKGDQKYAIGVGMWLEGLVSPDPLVVSWIKTARLPNFPFSGAPGGFFHSQRFCANPWVDFGVYKDATGPGFRWCTTNGKGAGMADLAANLAGMMFWETLEQQGTNLVFNICSYVKPDWDERKNPNVDVQPHPGCPP